VKLPQGKKSSVAVEAFDGIACVRKTYNDNGDPREKCLRETAFYAYYAGLTLIPRLIESRPPTNVLVELLRGEPLSTWQQGRPRAEVEDLSRDHGRNVARFLQHVPPAGALAAARQDFPGGLGLYEVAGHTLGVVADHLAANAEFDLPGLHGAVDCARAAPGIAGFWGQEVLCKLDWNAANTIVEGGEITGYVDFEQSFFANRLIFVGTVIDHINVLSWPRAREGIEELCGDLPSPEMQYAAACFSMCRKILGCCRDGRIGYFTPERILAKLEKMRRATDS